MTKTDNADNFKIQQDMMTATGVWPKRNPDTLYILKGVSSWVFIIALFVVQGMEVIYDLTDFTKLSEILYIEVTVIATIVKLASFMIQKQKFLKIIDFLKDPVFVSYPDNLDHYMVKAVKISTFLANMYRYLVAACVMLFLVYPIVDSKPLPFPFPYDLGKYTLLMYAVQITGEAYGAWNNSCMDTLTTSLMGIGAAQLDILCEKIIGMNYEEPETDNYRERESNVIKNLKQCVEHHNAIIVFIESIEDLFTLGLLAQFIASAVVICNTVFHIVLISTVNSQFFLLVDYFMVMIAELFMYCWFGNEIILKSERLRDACYTSTWYNSGNEARKYLFIIMERAKRPLIITTLKFSKLSLTAFTSILQWSYSFLALLIRMYQKRSGKE